MNVKMKRFDKSVPMPAYQSIGAAGVDLYARETVNIEPHQIGYIPLNIAVEIPEDYWLLIASRGSTHKHGIIMANGLGVGDADFCGNDNEYIFPAYNFTDQPVVIEKGLRMAQAILMPLVKMEIEEVETLDGDNRGLFGSTGHR